jgi:putative ABC transport system permease protein
MNKQNGENIQRQIVLPLRKAVEISFKSLKIRFWRSLITTGSIVLGIAFLTSIFTTNIIIESLIERGAPEIALKLNTEEAGTGPAQIWLVSLSLLVCVVGITNAMLMSVTERYREIGTMKCLGALDSFVKKLFLIESLFQGFFGAIIGVVIGALFAFLSGLFAYGGQVFTTLSWQIFLLWCLGALLVGIIMSVIGSMFPAAVAARMVPADAMRTEF